jgi:hypothetical protein
MILDDSWYCENPTFDCGLKFPKVLALSSCRCSFCPFLFLVYPLNFCCRALRLEFFQLNLDVSVREWLFRYLGFFLTFSPRSILLTWATPQ